MGPSLDLIDLGLNAHGYRPKELGTDMLPGETCTRRCIIMTAYPGGTRMLTDRHDLLITTRDESS